MSAARKSHARQSAPPTNGVSIAPAVAPEPHPLGPLRGVVCRWWIVLGVTIVLVGAALLAASAKAPTYTASSDINVGRVDVRVQTLPGYVAGAQALATAYARIATSDVVINPLAKRLGAKPADVTRRLYAVPVPGGTSFRIYGSGSSEADALRLVRAATDQMKTYVLASENGKHGLDDMLSQYHDQSTKVASLRRKINALEALASPTPAASATAAPKVSKATREKRADELQRLQAQLDTAQLEQQTIGGQYAERDGELAGTAGIQVLNTPVAAASDRHRTLQRYAAVGLIAGVLLGSGLALLFDRWRASRPL